MTYGLTAVQKETLDFIRSYLGEYGVSPSFEEIKDNVGLSSKSGVHWLVSQLIDRGALRKLPGRNRSLALVDPSTREFHWSELIEQLRIRELLIPMARAANKRNQTAEDYICDAVEMLIEVDSHD